MAPAAILAGSKAAAADIRLTNLVADLRGILDEMETVTVEDDQDSPDWNRLIERERLAFDEFCRTRAEGPVGLVAKARA